MKNISIMGCGWLGKVLFEELSKNYSTKCFLRGKTVPSDDFYKSDILIIAINTKDNYLRTLHNTISLAPKSTTVILMSSISVYREFDSDVDESFDIKVQSLQKDAEDIVINSVENSIILRLGGLMGEDRVAGKWKKVSIFEDGYANYVHRDDVVSIVKTLLNSDIKRGIYNVVAPIHPTRQEIHKKNASKFGLILGTFNGFSNRRVSSQKLINELNYTFLYPNPLDFWDNLVTSC